MTGIIGVVANDSARFTLFTACLTGLQVPDGTKIEWALGSDRISGRNKVVRAMMDDPECEWVCFIDDDHCFSSDMLVRLLAHGKPITTGIYTQRVAPFTPVLYTDKDDETDQYTAVFLPDYDGDQDALVPIRAGGTGAMLIRREVFDAMPGDPWFVHTEHYGSEDLYFCEEARTLGFQAWCDLSIRVGHMTSTIVWPTVQDGEWCMGFTVGGFEMHLPIDKEIRV